MYQSSKAERPLYTVAVVLRFKANQISSPVDIVHVDHVLPVEEVKGIQAESSRAFCKILNGIVRPTRMSTFRKLPPWRFRRPEELAKLPDGHPSDRAGSLLVERVQNEAGDIVPAPHDHRQKSAHNSWVSTEAMNWIPGTIFPSSLLSLVRKRSVPA